MIMAKFKEGKYRQVTGYLRQRLGKRNIQGLSASGEIDDELWILLEYYSEIESVGLNFLKNNGLQIASQRRKVLKHFQAYVRQAKGYYYSAKILPPRSSGLLYYYCFFNLVKAALVIKYPSIAGSKEHHGLEFKFRSGDKFDNQVIRVKRSGIFPKLYDWYFGESIKEGSLNIKTLLNYCTDISYQCQIGGIHDEKILYSYCAHAVHKSKRTGWALLGIPNASSLLEYPKTFSYFIKNFEKVDMPQLSCREIFDIDANHQSSFIFFQSSSVKRWISDDIPPALEVRDELLKAFGKCLQTNLFAKDFDFIISLPYKTNNQIGMDETLSIYLIMFYLSNLVRYNPQYLESLLSKKEAWLIDSFTRSCPVTFLRGIVSRIVNTDYIIERR